jgi:hypothetical protein
MGAINVKHTGSGADIALSSDGTSLLLDGTAIGGGGADLYAANESSPQAQPSATGTNAVAIGDDAVASGEHSFAAMLDSEASGTQSIAIGRNALSSGSLATAIGYAATSAGSQSVALGQAYASGTDSFAAAIDNNTSSYGATGNNSIAGGYLNKATGSDSIAWGGDSNVTANSQATVVGGWLNVNYGGYSTIVGGRGNVIYGSYSRAGGFNSYTGDNVGKDVWATDDFSTAGDSQTAKRVLMAATTDATATVLTTQRGTPNANNQVSLPNNGAQTFSGTIIARQSAADGSNYASWEIKGALLRDANAASTVLGNGIVNKLFATAGASAWAIALTADTTNGCLKIEATGAAATNIRWVSTVHTSEVQYA